MGMATKTEARTARIPHLCDPCHWTASLRGVPTIAPGHRYLRHTAFPGAEGNESGRVVTNTECVACACEREPLAGTLIAGACSTFCHGDTPCALPFGHGGERHSCMRCIAEKNDQAPGTAGHTCPVFAVVGDDKFPCQSHEGEIPAHHFAAHWPPCPAPFCKLPPGHRELHDVPAGRARIVAPVEATQAAASPQPTQ